MPEKITLETAVKNIQIDKKFCKVVPIEGKDSLLIYEGDVFYKITDGYYKAFEKRVLDGYIQSPKHKRT